MTQVFDPVNILIVDDEPKNLAVLETLLDDPGYRVVRAESPDQALLALVVEDFALLILDIRMPGMSGFELAQMIKNRRKNAHVPIIFLTAYFNEDQHVLAGYGTGAVDYLHKPVNAAALRSKVAVFVELHRKNRECELANRALLAEVVERRRVEDQLRELNERLDRRVIERSEALFESERRLRAIFDGTQEYMGLLTPDGILAEANRSTPSNSPAAGAEDRRRSSLLGDLSGSSGFTPGGPRARAGSGRPGRGRRVGALPSCRSSTPSGHARVFDDLIPARSRDEAGRVGLIILVALDALTERRDARGGVETERIGSRTSSWRCSPMSCATPWPRSLAATHFPARRQEAAGDDWESRA